MVPNKHNGKEDGNYHNGLSRDYRVYFGGYIMGIIGSSRARQRHLEL